MNKVVPKITCSTITVEMAHTVCECAAGDDRNFWWSAYTFSFWRGNDCNQRQRAVNDKVWNNFGCEIYAVVKILHSSNVAILSESFFVSIKITVETFFFLQTLTPSNKI